MKIVVFFYFSLNLNRCLRFFYHYLVRLGGLFPSLTPILSRTFSPLISWERLATDFLARSYPACPSRENEQFPGPEAVRGIHFWLLPFSAFPQSAAFRAGRSPFL